MAIQSPLWQSLWPSFRGVYRLESTPRAFSCEPTGIPNFKIQGLECGHAKISAWPSMSVKCQEYTWQESRQFDTKWSAATGCAYSAGAIGFIFTVLLMGITCAAFSHPSFFLFDDPEFCRGGHSGLLYPGGSEFHYLCHPYNGHCKP